MFCFFRRKGDLLVYYEDFDIERGVPVARKGDFSVLGCEVRPAIHHAKVCTKCSAAAEIGFLIRPLSYNSKKQIYFFHIYFSDKNSFCCVILLLVIQPFCFIIQNSGDPSNEPERRLLFLQAEDEVSFNSYNIIWYHVISSMSAIHTIHIHIYTVTS